jgi:HPt (histidine-containing phosphotransfer) domain-containing protein
LSQTVKELLQQMPSIDVDDALKRLGGKTDLLIKLIAAFKNEFDGISDRLTQAVNEERIDDAIIMAHSLKGASGTISAINIAKKASEIEELLNKRNIEEARTVISQLETPLSQLLQNASKLKDQTAERLETTQIRFNFNELSLKIKELFVTLENNNFSAESIFNELKPYLLKSNISDKIADLEASISLLEFDKAIMILEQISSQLKISYDRSKS